MNFEKFLIKELKEYIRHELNSGYSINSIKRVLLAKGHEKTIVDQAIGSLREQKFRPKIVKYTAQKTLSSDAFNYVTGMLKDYIKHQKSKGYTDAEIKQVLLNYGNSYEAIEAAMMGLANLQHKPKQFVEHHERPRKKSSLPVDRIVFPACLIAMIAVLFIVSVNVDEPVFLVLFGFSPSILSLLGTEVFRKDKNIILFIPIVVCALFLIIVSAINVPLFSNMDVFMLTGLNLVVSYVFSVIYLLEHDNM